MNTSNGQKGRETTKKQIDGGKNSHNFRTDSKAKSRKC